MKLKDAYGKLYESVKSGKYDIVVADVETFEMETNISFVDRKGDLR